MGHLPELEHLEWWLDATRRKAGRVRLPVTWVAGDPLGHVIGVVRLGEFDVEERRDRSPWVLGMVVAAQQLGAGVGSLLLTALEVWASQRGYAQAWVATGGRAATFYQKCGRERVEIVVRHGDESVSVLTNVLRRNAVTLADTPGS